MVQQFVVSHRLAAYMTEEHNTNVAAVWPELEPFFVCFIPIFFRTNFFLRITQRTKKKIYNVENMLIMQYNYF